MSSPLPFDWAGAGPAAASSISRERTTVSRGTDPVKSRVRTLDGRERLCPFVFVREREKNMSASDTVAHELLVRKRTGERSNK